MAWFHRRRSVYVLGFVAVCWGAIAAVAVIFLLLAHFVKSDALAINLFLGLIYSCLFGFMGWQMYRWRGKRDGWPMEASFVRRSKRAFAAVQSWLANVSRCAIEVEIGGGNAVSKPLVVKTTLTTKELERLNRLRRRCEWLKRRIANHHGDAGFDKSEASALEWAIQFIEDATAW